MARDPNKSEKSDSKSLEKFPLPPLPFAHHIKEEKKEKQMDEATQMIQHMRKMHDEIDQMMNEALEKTGWTPNFLKNYLENPNNFSGEDWERMQQQRKELMDSVKTPKELKEAEENAKKMKKVPLGQEGMPTSKISKERRSKAAAARRNWLPMR